MSTLLGKASKFHICMDDVTLTGNSGIVLLRDFISRLELPDLVDRMIHVKDRERGYPESQNVLALTWNLILGGDSLRDLNVMRGDAGLTQLLDVNSVLAPTTAGEFLRHFSKPSVIELRHFLQRAAERIRPYQKSRRITLDLDASLYAQCSERKEGSRMNYQGEIGYNPLFCFWAEEAELIFSHLQSGNARAIKKADWFLRQVLQRLPPRKKRFLRADSEFYNWNFICLCEAEEITYAITAPQKKQLKARIAAQPESAWRQFGTDAEVAEFEYAPARHKPHRYVVKRSLQTNSQGERNWHYHVIVTNDRKRGAKTLLHWFYKKCAMENLIKEHKHDFGLEKFPTQRYRANLVWLLVGQLAWNMVAWFKRLCLPAPCHTQTIKTLRHRLFHVAGKIVHQSRQLYLVISEKYEFRELWSFALKKLPQLGHGSS